MESTQDEVTQGRTRQSGGDGSIELRMLLLAMACDVWHVGADDTVDAPPAP